MKPGHAGWVSLTHSAHNQRQMSAKLPIETAGWARGPCPWMDLFCIGPTPDCKHGEERENMPLPRLT